MIRWLFAKQYELNTNWYDAVRYVQHDWLQYGPVRRWRRIKPDCATVWWESKPLGACEIFNRYVAHRIATYWHQPSNTGAYRCSPIPIFHSSFVHHSLCFPVPIFPDPIFRSSYVPQSVSSPTMFALCFPVSVFPSSFASQSLCSAAPLFPSLDIPHKWFPVPMFPKDICKSFNISKHSYGPAN